MALVGDFKSGSTSDLIARSNQIKRSFSKEVMALADVMGFGVGGKSGPGSLAVYLRRENAQTRQQLLVILAGHVVDIEIAGEGRPL